MNDRVSITVTDHVADVRLTRADKLNAIDQAMFDGIIAAIDRLAGMAEVRAVVLSGEGRGFCSGLDMAAMAGDGSGPSITDRPWGDTNFAQQVAWGWRMLPMPVIAAVHGFAVGGGIQIVSGADIRIAAPGTKFSIREGYWGLIAGMAGNALWRGLVRDDVVRELIYTAREFLAEEALELGFVTRIAEDPHAVAMALAREIASRNPHAVRASKRLLNLAADADPATILRAETDEQLKIRRQPNQIEAVKAHMEKRPPVFRD